MAEHITYRHSTKHLAFQPDPTPCYPWMVSYVPLKN